MTEVGRRLAVATGLLDKGDIDAALAEARAAVDSAEAAGDSLGRAEAVRQVAHALSQAGDHAEALEVARQEIQHCEAAAEAAPRATALVAKAEALLARGGAEGGAEGEGEGAEEALASATEARSLLSGAGAGASARAVEAAALLVQANANLRRGDQRRGDPVACYQAALEAGKAAVELFQTGGDVKGQAMAMHATAAARMHGNNFEGAIRSSKEALRLWQSFGVARYEVLELQSLALWHLKAGRPEQALPFAQEAHGIAQDETGCCPASWEAAALRLTCQALCAARRFDRAVSLAMETTSLARTRGALRVEVAALTSLLEAHLVRGKTWEALRAAGDALAAASRLGDVKEQVSLLRTSAQLNLRLHRFDDALQSAKRALKLCQDSVGSLAERSGCVLAVVKALSASRQDKEAMQILEDERDHYNEAEDPRREAIALLSMVSVHLQRSNYQDAVWAAEDALSLFEESDDRGGQAASLQMLAEVHLAAKDFDASIEAAGKAVPFLEAAGDRRGQVGTLLLIAQAVELSLAAGQLDPTSTKFRQGALKALQSSKDALALAERIDDRALRGSTLCSLSRISRMAMRCDEAMKAAGAAAGLFREGGDRRGEAYALYLGADAAAAIGQSERAREGASKALLLFRQAADAPGEALAEEVLDRLERALEQEVAEHPALSAEGLAPRALEVAAAAGHVVATARGVEVAAQLNRKVRATVIEIVGVTELDDDTPLMQTGLTSQSAVLLRNALTKEIGGTSLPFTMMFDFPSVSALTDYFVQRAGE